MRPWGFAGSLICPSEPPPAANKEQGGGGVLATRDGRYSNNLSSLGSGQLRYPGPPWVLKTITLGCMQESPWPFFGVHAKEPHTRLYARARTAPHARARRHALARDRTAHTRTRTYAEGGGPARARMAPARRLHERTHTARERMHAHAPTWPPYACARTCTAPLGCGSHACWTPGFYF